MPRTIESIAENHAVASARRAAGKPVWDRKIDIKSILREDNDNTSPEHSEKVAHAIAKRIRAAVPKHWIDPAGDNQDDELVELLDSLESVSATGDCYDRNFRPVDDLNATLDALYDWADSKRVWLGA